jgi:hypothetical protein
VRRCTACTVRIQHGKHLGIERVFHVRRFLWGKSLVHHSGGTGFHSLLFVICRGSGFCKSASRLNAELFL